MVDKICLDACESSFKMKVNRLNEVLFDALIQADGDAELEKNAQENFQRGLALARKVRDICVVECNT